MTPQRSTIERETATSRLLTLLSLLQTGREWPGTSLAERLQVSPRTVRRDVDRLRTMGYGIRGAMGPEGGYRLDAGSELPPLLFDDEQVVALTLALQAAATTGAGIEEAALRALLTVRHVLPPRLRQRLAAVEFETVPRAGDATQTPVAPEVLVALSTAVRAREVLRFDEVGAGPAADGGRRSPRRVEPHHLLVSSGRWYLLAWDLERADWRIFRADRIVPRHPTSLRFAPRTVPGGDARAFVAARFRGALEGGGWPCVGAVVLHAPASSVRPFAGDGTVEELDTERCRYTVGSWSWIALAASLGRFDAAIEVIAPEELRLAFAELASRNAATAASTAVDDQDRRSERRLERP
ncbi:putative DNA-binding transcriptional regulator YafY [Agrococcus sp. UYP33]